MINDKEINDKLNQSIQRVIDEIEKEPLIVNRECAIQARLYRYLCEALDEWQPHHTIHFNKYGVKNKISRVQLEFFGGAKRAIDLIILDKNKIDDMELFSFEKQTGKHLLLSHAVEIKAELFAQWGKEKRKEKIFYDLEKLKSLQKKNNTHLHFIYVCRRATRSQRVQQDIMQIVTEIRKDCGKNITFHTNNPKNYFYPYENKAIK